MNPTFYLQTTTEKFWFMNEQLKDLVNDIKSLIYNSNVNFGILKFSLAK